MTFKQKILPGLCAVALGLYMSSGVAYAMESTDTTAVTESTEAVAGDTSSALGDEYIQYENDDTSSVEYNEVNYSEDTTDFNLDASSDGYTVDESVVDTNTYNEDWSSDSTDNMSDFTEDTWSDSTSEAGDATISVDSDDVAAVAGFGAILAGMGMILVIISLAICVVLIASMWKIFEKAGEAGWKSLIPILNTYVLTQICTGKGILFLLLCVPFVNFVFAIYLTYRLNKVFGGGTLSFILLLICPIIIYPIMAFGKEAEYQGADYK